MNLTSPKIIKELLARYGTKPSKGLGQNFLADRRILAKIIETAQIKPSDTIIEIGPGVGTLTRELAEKAGKVVTIEKDRKMAEILTKTLAEFKNIEIIQDDALEIFNSQLSITNQFSIKEFSKNYKVIANLPYYITSPIIRMFLESENQPEEMILMVQKEVAQRICAKAPNMSLLSVSVQFYAEPKIVSYVSKNCFWPSPKVDSAILKIVPRNDAETYAESRGTYNKKFFEIARAGFSQPRKQLAGNLSRQLKKDKKLVDLWLLKNNINPKQRAETLSVQDWTNLTTNYSL